MQLALRDAKCRWAEEGRRGRPTDYFQPPDHIGGTLVAHVGDEHILVLAGTDGADRPVYHLLNEDVDTSSTLPLKNLLRSARETLPSFFHCQTFTLYKVMPDGTTRCVWYICEGDLRLPKGMSEAARLATIFNHQFKVESVLPDGAEPTRLTGRIAVETNADRARIVPLDPPGL
jgi:hypothetical protein